MNTEAEWADPDDAPEADSDWFDKADLYRNDVLTKRGRGRPAKGAEAKVQQSLRLSPDVLEHFRSTGPGWHGRIDAVLRRHVERVGRAAKTRG